MNDWGSPDEPAPTPADSAALTAPNGGVADNEPVVETKSRWWRRPKLIIPLIVVVVLVAGGVSFALTRGTSNKISVVGTMVLSDDTAFWTAGDTCAGSGGYDDISNGTAVTVKDEKGAIIATGGLSGALAESSSSCLFVVIVRDVPTAKFYSVEVSHRGAVTEPASGVKDGKLSVALTLGS